MTLSSFWYAFLITLITILIAYPTAYWLTKTKHKQLWLLLIIIPSWINLLLKAYAFIGIFGLYGPANKLLQTLGAGPWQILFTDFSFIFVSVYIFIPFMVKDEAPKSRDASINAGLILSSELKIGNTINGMKI